MTHTKEPWSVVGSNGPQVDYADGCCSIMAPDAPMEIDATKAKGIGLKNLNDQWIEVINGVEHMVKAVEADRYNFCKGCFHASVLTISKDNEYNYFYCCREDGCCFDGCGLIVKDLGILKNGCLPSSFGQYPIIQAPSVNHEPWYIYADTGGADYEKEEKAWGNTEQQAIDAWNRRA